MKINVSLSTDEKARQAGKNCAKKAVLDLIQTKLAIMFSSDKYNQEELLAGAKSVLGTAPIIGYASSEGIVVQDGYINNIGYVGMMAIGDSETSVGTAISYKIKNARETGRSVAKRAMERVGTKSCPAYYMIFANCEDEEEYIEGIKDIIGEVPCIGGSPKSDNMKIFTEEGIVEKGVAVAFFYTNKKIENIFESKYHETVKSGVINKVTGNNIIDEIDGIKALKKYCEWTDTKVKDVKDEKICETSILKPLAVKTSDGTKAIIRRPLNGNKNYSIDCKNKISVNTAIIQMQISKKELIDGPKTVTRELKQKIKYNDYVKDEDEINKIRAYLIFQNYARKQILNDDIDEMVDKLKNEIGDIPFIMTFTNSEYGKIKSNHISKLMISEVAFCDL